MTTITQSGSAVTIDFDGGASWQLDEAAAMELAQKLNTHFARRTRKRDRAKLDNVSLPCDVGD